MHPSIVPRQMARNPAPSRTRPRMAHLGTVLSDRSCNFAGLCPTSSPCPMVVLGTVSRGAFPAAPQTKRRASFARAPDARRGRAPDRRGRQARPSPPTRRDHDPRGLPPRPARQRARRPALGPGRPRARHTARAPSQKRHPVDAPAARSGAARPAQARRQGEEQRALRLHQRAQRPDDNRSVSTAWPALASRQRSPYPSTRTC